MYIHIYIYIYIYVDIDIDIDIDIYLSIYLSLSLSIYIYIYIYFRVEGCMPFRKSIAQASLEALSLLACRGTRQILCPCESKFERRIVRQKKINATLIHSKLAPKSLHRSSQEPLGTRVSPKGTRRPSKRNPKQPQRRPWGCLVVLLERFLALFGDTRAPNGSWDAL